ncbi:MAG: hypothetical protein ABIO44_02180 [Saprospiraceae bacterium]
MIGYTLIFVENYENYLEDFINFVNMNDLNCFKYNCNDDSVVPISLDNNLLKNLIENNNLEGLRIESKNFSYMMCGFSLSKDSAYIEENYSLEQQTEDIEFENVYNLIYSRFKELNNKDLAKGFVFDKQGYSLDYIELVN